MSDLNALFAKVESLEFMLGAYSANTLSSFVAYIGTMTEFSSIVNSIEINPDIKSSIVAQRVSKLIKLNPDKVHMHRYDSAVALYCYLLFKIDKIGFLELSRKIKLPQNTWWSRQMVEVLKTNFLTTTATASAHTSRNEYEHDKVTELSFSNHNIINEMNIVSMGRI